MLEIKCPVRRKIYTKGDIAGKICPFYYYCQVQQQLECCDLEVCDFWQCKLNEYKNRQEYLLDTDLKCVLTEGDQGKEIPIDKRITKGAIIELFPFNYEPRFAEDKPEYTAYYLYPPRLNLTIEQYDKWALDTVANWKEMYPELVKKYYFNKIIYWNMPSGHNVEVKRDRKWFGKIYPILEDTWKKVEYYRNHKDKLDELYDKGNLRKKFYRLETNFEINTELVKNKILFLEPDEEEKRKELDDKYIKNYFA